MLRYAVRLPFLVSCLLVPTLLYAQQGKTAAAPTNATVTATQLAAAEPKTPAEFFARARQLSDLEAAGVPFHLKATYVASGDADGYIGNGTIEEWWQSKDLWRKEATLGKFRYVAFSNGSEQKTFTSSAYIPVRLLQALAVSVVRISADAGSSSGWTMQQKEIRDLDLTVISDSTCLGESTNKKGHREKRTQPAEDDCGRRYIFTSHGLIRIQQRGGESIVYNDFQPFQTLVVPRAIAVGNGHTKDALKISIGVLERLPAHQHTVSFSTDVPAGMQPSQDIVNLTENPLYRTVKPPQLIYGFPAEIPWGDRHSGWKKKIVVIETAINEAGVPTHLRVVQSAGESFDIAALTSVRQYRFEPAHSNGKPVIAQIKLKIVFNNYLPAY